MRLPLVYRSAFRKLNPGLSLKILLIAVILGLAYFLYTQPNRTEDAEQRKLMQYHAEEITAAIENFHLIFDSLDIRINPENYSQILVGEYLNQMLANSGSLPGEIYITDNVDVTGIRILDYSPSSFRVIGCITLQQSLISSDGKPIRSLPPKQAKWLYAFVLDDGIWKVAAHSRIDDTDLIVQYWENVSDWEKELFGDLSDFVNKPCFSTAS